MSSGNINFQLQNVLLRKKSSRKNRLAAKYNKELDLDEIKETFLDELFLQSWKKNKDEKLEINKDENNEFDENENLLHVQNEFKSTLDLINKQESPKRIKNTEYDKKYKEYIQEELSFSHFNLINRIINDSNNLPEKIKLNYPLHKILYRIVKYLMMSELEMIYLSLFLDQFGWEIEELEEVDNNFKKVDFENKCIKIEFEENLLFISIFVKVNYSY